MGSCLKQQALVRGTTRWEAREKKYSMELEMQLVRNLRATAKNLPGSVRIHTGFAQFAPPPGGSDGSRGSERHSWNHGDSNR